MSSFRDRFGSLTVGQARELNEAAMRLARVCEGCGQKKECLMFADIDNDNPIPICPECVVKKILPEEAEDD